MDLKVPELQYRKSMDHNYLVAELKEGYENDYRLIMMLENSIPGLLKAVRRMNEGRQQIYFEISSMQPLNRIFDHKEIKKADAARLLQGVTEIFKSIQEYMLSEGAMILDPEYLFVDPESLKPCALYLPWSGSGMQERFLVLMEYLMEHIDQSDPTSAMWTYRLYKAAKNENCVLGDIEKLIADQTVPVKKATGTKAVYMAEDISVNNDHEAIVPMNTFGNDIDIIDEEEEEENERRQGLFTRIFGSRTKDKKEKTEKKAPKKDRKKDAEPVLSVPDFSEAFEDMEVIDTEDDDYGKTVFVGRSDEPLKNMLVEKNKGRQIMIEKFPFTIGKVKNCVDLPLADNSVSRIHARIFMQNGHPYIQDCHSTNGTFINGVQLEAEEQVMLEKEDEIGIGRVKFSYH